MLLAISNQTSERWLLAFQGATVLLLFAGLVFAAFQIRAVIKTNRASNYFSLVAYLQREDIRTARGIVGGIGKPDGTRHRREEDGIFVNTVYEAKHFDDWPATHRDAAQHVASSFDIMAVAIYSRLVPRKVFSFPWRTSIMRNHRKLRHFVLDRQKRERDVMYLANFDRLGRELRLHRIRERNPKHYRRIRRKAMRQTVREILSR